MPRPAPSLRSRLFLTAWILFGLMFATNIVREHYPALALVEDGSYRLDRYHELHSDIFEHDGHWYINNNVGTSVHRRDPAAAVQAAAERARGALEGGARERAAARSTPRFDTSTRTASGSTGSSRQNGWELKFGARRGDHRAAPDGAALGALRACCCSTSSRRAAFAATRAVVARDAVRVRHAGPVPDRAPEPQHDGDVRDVRRVPRARAVRGLERSLPRAGAGRAFAAGILGGRRGHVRLQRRRPARLALRLWSSWPR